MEAVGGTASIITLLATAGGACRFLYTVFLDLADAPQDIDIYTAKLRRLDSSIQHLSQAYQKLPQDFELGSQLWNDIKSFRDEVTSLKAKVEAKGLKLKGNRKRRAQESCKWLMFDRQLRKFSESTDHWNKILSQTALAAQVALCIRIDANTTTLLAMAPKPEIVSIPMQGTCSKETIRSLPSSVAPIQLSSDLQHVLNANIPVDHRANSFPSPRLAEYLSTVMDPVGVRLQHWITLKFGAITATCICGPIIVRSWSSGGREVYRHLPITRGYAITTIVQHSYLIPSRVSISWFGLCPKVHIPKISLYWNLQWAGLFDFGGSHHEAIKRGDEAYLRQKLSSQVLRIYDTTANGDTLLHLAAGHNQENLINLLLNVGADVNAVNNKGETPLHVSLRTGRNYECARILLSRGADACREDKDGRTPLHSFFNNAISMLIRHNSEDIDIASQDHRGMTSLHWACWSSRTSLEDIASQISLELKAWSPYMILDVHGKSILHFAVERGNTLVVDYLMSHPYGSKMALPDHSGCSLLHYAIASGRTELIDSLIERKDFPNIDPYATDNHGRTILHHAAMRGNVNAVKHLFDINIAQPNIQDNDGRTALQLAQLYRSRSVVEYLQIMCRTQTTDQFREEDTATPSVGTTSHATWRKRKLHAIMNPLSKATLLILFLFFGCCHLLQVYSVWTLDIHNRHW